MRPRKRWRMSWLKAPSNLSPVREGNSLISINDFLIEEKSVLDPVIFSTRAPEGLRDNEALTIVHVLVFTWREMIGY